MMQHSNGPQHLYSPIPYSILQGEDYTPSSGPIYPGKSHLDAKIDRYVTTRGVLTLAEYNKLAREMRPPVVDPKYRHLCETWVKYHAGTPLADELYGSSKAVLVCSKARVRCSSARTSTSFGRQADDVAPLSPRHGPHAQNRSRREGPRGSGMQIGALIRRAALHFGDAPASSKATRVVSFREFDALTDRLGNALLALGLSPAIASAC